MKKEPVRFDHMTEQYIWSLENDQDFVVRAKCYAQQGAFHHFRRQVGASISPIRRMIGEADAHALNGYEWSFLYLELWKRMGGKGAPHTFSSSTVAHDFQYQIDRAAVVNMAWTFADGYTPTAIKINPCAEIALGEPQPCILQQPEGNPTMSIGTTKMSPAFETISYVFGNDVRTMSEEALIQAIKKVEEQIADLKAVKTKSTKIAANIAKLQEQLAAIVAELDAR